jgi:glucose PTS system EIICBA or EIICB component
VAVVKSPFAGHVVPLDDVDDEVFSERVMGDGVAVRPTSGEVLAPLAGRIEKLFRGGHGVAIEDDEGLQVLVHIGLETVKLEGDGFTVHTTEGATVGTGDLIVTVDLDRLNELGVDPVSPIVVISGHDVSNHASGQVAVGDRLFESS